MAKWNWGGGKRVEKNIEEISTTSGFASPTLPVCKIRATKRFSIYLADRKTLITFLQHFGYRNITCQVGKVGSTVHSEIRYKIIWNTYYYRFLLSPPLVLFFQSKIWRIFSGQSSDWHQTITCEGDVVVYDHKLYLPNIFILYFFIFYFSYFHCWWKNKNKN